jgi:hypothetical protein
MLSDIEKEGLAHIISWLPHGRAFAIHKPNLFEKEIMPQYFKQSKITSFHRQLNLYGFRRLTQGRDNGGYYNEYFLRGKPLLTRRMIRIKVKGTKIRAASSPEDEPNFYNMIPSNANVRGISNQPSSNQSAGNQLPLSQDPSSVVHERNQVISSHSAAQGLIGLSCQGNTQPIPSKSLSSHHLNNSGQTNRQVSRLTSIGVNPSFEAQRPQSMTAGQFNQDNEQEVLLALLRNQQQQQQLSTGMLNPSHHHDVRNDQLSLLLSNLMNPGLQQQQVPSNLPQQAPTQAALSNLSQMMASMQPQTPFNGCSLQSQFQDILSMRSGRHHALGGNNGGVGNSSMFLRQSPQASGLPLPMPSTQGIPSLSAFQNVRDDDLEMLLLQMQLQRRMSQGRSNNMSTSS